MSVATEVILWQLKMNSESNSIALMDSDCPPLLNDLH